MKENPGKSFEIESLDNDESQLMYKEIKKALNINEGGPCNTQLIFASADNYLPNLIDYQDEIDDSVIREVLIGQFGSALDDELYIFWDSETPIDAIKVNVLVENWDYIWYDASDEAILVFNHNKWRLALITEQGYLMIN